MPRIRVYVAGSLTVESPSSLLREEDFAERGGRLAFAFLVIERRRSIPPAELAEVLWPEGPRALA